MPSSARERIPIAISYMRTRDHARWVWIIRAAWRHSRTFEVLAMGAALTQEIAKAAVAAWIEREETEA